ncbi:MAG: LysE family translocator [Holophagales bacterium]|nr:MAG: LysE family translocator [Holophagales bacterium]
MVPAAHLWVFFLLVFGIVLLPGLDMACVLACTLGGGRRAGLASLGGIVTAAMAHVAIGGMGIAAILLVLPGLFNALLVGGAAYVAWIGMAMVRHGALFDTRGTSAAAVALPTAYRRGVLTNLLNPKAYVFMLAVFPQFVRAEWGAVPLQAAALGGVIVATQLVVYGVVVLAATRARRWLTERPHALALAGRGVGLLLLVVALFSALEGWRRLT